MGEAAAVVFVIDDDLSMRGALEDLIGSVGLQVRAFASPQEFLDCKRPEAGSCPTSCEWPTAWVLPNHTS